MSNTASHTPLPLERIAAHRRAEKFFLGLLVPCIFGGVFPAGESEAPR